MNFDLLVQSIADVHRQMQARAVKAVNVGLTLRNWLIGAYISEYELRGEDRAAYGEQLLETLSDRLVINGLQRAEARNLRRYRLFYRTYPQIRETVSPEFELLLPGAAHAIKETPSPESSTSEIVAALSPQSTHDPIHRTVSGELQTPGRILLERLSYSHLELLAPIDHPLKRAFYEIEAIKGGWSVRELKRQIGALYFERSGLSKDPEALARLAHDAAEPQNPAHLVSDPFIFSILLCTEQNDELVRYALAGLDHQAFVSRYQLELPATEELEAFVKQEIASWKEGRE